MALGAPNPTISRGCAAPKGKFISTCRRRVKLTEKSKLLWKYRFSERILSLDCLLAIRSLKPMNTGISAINEEVQRASAFVRPLFSEISESRHRPKENYLVERLAIGLLANGHILLEGVRTELMTLSVKTLANCLSMLNFSASSIHSPTSSPARPHRHANL